MRKNKLNTAAASVDEDDQPLLASVIRERGVGLSQQPRYMGGLTRRGDAQFTEDAAPARTYEQDLALDKEEAQREIDARRSAKTRVLGNAIMRVGGLKMLLRMPNWLIGGEEAKRDHWVAAQKRALRRARGLLALQRDEVNDLIKRKSDTVAEMEERVRMSARRGTREGVLAEVKRLTQMRASMKGALDQSTVVQSQLDDIEKLMSGITTMATRASVVSVLAQTFSASDELQAFAARLTQSTEEMAFVKQTFAHDMEDALMQIEVDATNAAVGPADVAVELLPASNAPGLVSEQERPALERELARVLAGADRGAGAMLAT